MGQMKQFEKERWHGQALIEKIGLYSVMVLEIAVIFILPVFEEDPIIGTFIVIGIAFYFLGLYAFAKSQSEKNTKLFGGKKMWKGRYDLGRGRTGKFKWMLRDHYPLEDASESLKQHHDKTIEIVHREEEKQKLNQTTNKKEGEN